MVELPVECRSSVHQDEAGKSIVRMYRGKEINLGVKAAPQCGKSAIRPSASTASNFRLCDARSGARRRFTKAQPHAIGRPTKAAGRLCEQTSKVAFAWSNILRVSPHCSGVGIRLRRDHRTAPPTSLYLEQRWGLGGQVQHELDVARCLENNGLRHV
jgi:hypothetical protein